MEITENVLQSGMRLWYARPDTTEPRPLMVMLHERYGPVEQSWNVVRTMASYGYVACLSDLFHRYEGDRGPIERSEARYDPTDEQTVIDIDESIAFMRGLDFVDGDKVGIVGFCWSGRTPMVYSAAGRDVSAIAVFHGGIYPREYEPIFEGIERLDDVLPRVTAPILAGFGEHDQLVPLENVVRFRRDLEAQGKRARLQVLSGTGHGWFNVTRPKDYDEAASNRSWDMLDAFVAEAFAGTLGAGPNVEFNADASISFDFSV